jgi:ATP-binding cassette subfamily F protein 3
LAGRLAALSGSVTRAPKLGVGFFAQHQIEEMRPDESAFDHLAALMPDGTPEAVRTRLGGFGFGQNKALVPVASLSGGERARLNLALVTHDAPSLLILDEPTNHLDMETREALVEALAEYSGAVVLVSHDWHLVELVADQLWLVADGTVRPFEGDLDAYRAILNRSEPDDERRPSDRSRSDDGRSSRREAAQRRLALEPLRRQSREAASAAERLTKELAALDRRLASSAPAPGDGAAVTEALKRRAELTRLIAEAEADWLAAEEAMEQETLAAAGSR